MVAFPPRNCESLPKIEEVCQLSATIIASLPDKDTYNAILIFCSSNHEEVDVVKAVEIGHNDTLDEILFGAEGYDEEGDDNDDKNETAQRMLLRLPGITPASARKIMSECESIAELAELSREELKLMVGPVTGQKLFTFFRQRYSA